MKMGIKAMVSSLALVFAVAGCENSRDAARKPEVVEPLVKTSLTVTDSTGNQDAYAHRLRVVLMGVDTQDLEVLRDHNVTVSLDSRLANQNVGSLDTPILGTLYNQDPSHPIVALFDNGKVGPDGSSLGTDTDDYGSSILSQLADRYRDGDISPRQPFEYAGAYTVSDGDCSYTAIEWSPSKNFDQDTIRKNPILKTPPVKNVLPGPNN